VAVVDSNRVTTQTDLLHAFRTAPLKMARTRSELFGLLAFFHPSLGWDKFVRMIDFSDVTPAQIYQIVFGRAADTPRMAVAYPGYDPAAHFREALLSHEFRKHIQHLFLRSHPEKARDVFIHIPKCAGTDLILNLGHRSVPLPKLLELDGWLTDDEFLETVAGLARAALSHDRLFPYGHMELGDYAAEVGVRPIDRVFTVLRDPIDLLISQANYAIGRIRQDPTGKAPDAADYLARLHLTAISDQISNGELKTLTLRALLDPTIAEPDRACFYLGRGARRRYDIALQNLIVHNVEITTTDRYNRWLAERWGLNKSLRHNSSQTILTKTEAMRLAPQSLINATLEDQKLFDVVSFALEKSGRASIFGPDLVRIIGAELLDAMDRNEIPPAVRGTERKTVPPRILVADDPEKVAYYTAAVSGTIPGAVNTETVLDVSFGLDGESQGYRLQGWARPEPRFTWTAAEESVITLPPLAGPGRFIFRLVASPYIHRGDLQAQQVSLFAGDISLGECRVNNTSVLECELPASLIGTGQPSRITLRLPNAARPRLVSGANDDRLLALAVHGIGVLRVPDRAMAKAEPVP